MSKTTISLLVISAYIIIQMIPKFYTVDTVCTVERVIVKDVSTYSWDDDHMVKAVVSPPAYPKVHPRKFSAGWPNTLYVATRMAEHYANGTSHWCKVRLGTRSIPQLQDMTVGPESELIIPVFLVILSGICFVRCSLVMIFGWCDEKEKSKRRSISVQTSSDIYSQPSVSNTSSIIIDEIDV